MVKTISIVIAYYSKRLDWITNLLSKFKHLDIRIFVYSKGSKLPIISKLPNNVISIQYIKRKNVGRNDETFLYHIYTYYNILDGMTLFIKDSSLSNLYVNGISRQLNELDAMVKIAYKKGYMCNTTDYDKKWREDGSMVDWVLDSYDTNHDQSGNKFIKAKPRGIYNWVAHTLKGESNSTGILDRIKKPCTKICYSGIFASTRTSIHTTSRSIYGKLLKNMQNGDNIEQGHYMERLWGFLFEKRTNRTRFDR